MSQTLSRRRHWRQGRRLYILPTRAGIAYAVLLLVLLLGAINYNNSLGHMLTFLLASLGLVGMQHCHRNLRAVDISLAAGEPVFCGQQAHFRLTVHNGDRQPVYGLDIGLPASTPSRWSIMPGRFRTRHRVPQVPPRSRANERLSLPASARGWIEAGPLQVSSRFPLGLFFSWTRFDISARTLVYPRPAGTRPLPQHSAAGQQPAGGEHDGDEDFSGLRRYRRGESLHAVAWKALARDDVMRSKQFSTPRGQSLLLGWRDLPDLATEARLSQLSAWVLAAEAAGLRYGLELPDALITPGRGAPHRHRCLKALALYETA